MAARQNDHLMWYPGHELLVADIVLARNCYLFDARGKRYVDLESGVWCTSIGHGNPRILRAIEAQAALIAHAGFNYSNGLVEETALEILSLLGFAGGRCVFLCSGSEAVEYGVRAAQSVASRPLMMTMADSYFGAYGSASRKQENEWFLFDWSKCPDCRHDGECGDRCERWSRIPFDRIEGFLFEPGSSSGLVRFPPVKLIRGIVAAVRKRGGSVLVNEVTTGVGRTGMWFGYQHYGISPDIVAIGKGIGNGYPVSATAFAPAMTDRLGGAPIKYAQSHQNDPLGAAVIRELVRVIQVEKLIERGREIAAVLLTGLEAIAARMSRVKEIRARGLMVGIELVDNAECSFTTRAHRELVRRGFIVGKRPGVAVLRLDPALTVELGDIELFLVELERVLADTTAGPAAAGGHSA